MGGKVYRQQWRAVLGAVHNAKAFNFPFGNVL
jgi:hypothetical protein